MANEVIGIEVLFESGDFDKGANKVIDGIERIIKQLMALNIMTYASGGNLVDFSKRVEEAGNKTIEAVNKINQTLSNMTGVGGGAGGGAGGGGGAPADDFMKGFANINWSRVIRDFQGFGSVLGGALGGPFGMALGSSLGKVFDDVLGGIKNAFTETFDFIVQIGEKAFRLLWEKASYFQDQMVYLNTLMARIEVDEGNFESVGEAIDLVGDKSEELLIRIQTLALETPYAVDEIMKMFKSLTGRGVSVDQTLETIRALSDAGAGLALPNYELTRLTQNLVQVATTGKLYERDIYEFGRAGINVAEMLSEYLGMTIEEAKAALKEGTITAEQFLDVFNAYTFDKFQGAAERMTRTITGMSQKLQDLINFMGKDLLGPLLEKLSEPFTKFIDAMVRLASTDVFKSIGNSIANMFESLGLFTSESVESIQLKLMQFIYWLVDIADTLADFGYKMMLEWGMGMVKGAVTAINAVVQVINSLLSWFLAPGSPPRAVPYIYDWGISAINEFLKGMTSADFSILKTIQSPIQTALSQLGFEPNDITAIMQDITYGFTQALSQFKLTGTVNESYFQQVANAVGPYGDAIAQLVRDQFALAIATQKVVDATNALEEANKTYKDADIAVRKLVQEYNDLVRAGASDDVLKAKKAEIDAQMGVKATAKATITEQEKILEQAQEEEKLAQEKAKAQEALVQQLLYLTKIQEDAASSAGDLADAIGGIELPTLDTSKLGLEGIGEGLDRELKRKLDLLERRLLIKLAQMRGKWNTFVDDLNKKWEDLDIQTLVDNFKELRGNIKKVSEALEGTAIDRFFKWLTKPETLTIIGEITGWFLVMATAIGAIAAAAALLNPLSATILYWSLVTSPIEPLDWEKIKTDISTGIDGIKTYLSEKYEEIKLAWDGFWDDIKEKTGIKWDEIKTKIGTKLDELKTNLSTWYEEMKIDWNTFLDNFNTKAGEKWDNIKTTIGTRLNSIKTNFNTNMDDMKTKASTIWNDIKTTVSTKIDEIGIKLSTFFTEKKLAWDTFWDDLNTKVTTVWEEIKTWIGEKVGEITTSLNNFVSPIDSVKSAFNRAKDAVSNLITKIGELITKLLGLKLPGWMTPGSPTPFELGIRGINNALDELNKSTLPKFAANINLVPSGVPSIRSYGRITPSTVSSTSTSNTFNFGGNNINNGMDAALFEAMVKRSLERIMT